MPITSIRAKFKCESVTHGVEFSGVTLVPVTSGSQENERFYKWTPGGKVELTVVKRDTAAAFQPGEDYYIDFTHAPKVAP
jgi:hypothetical protein